MTRIPLVVLLPFVALPSFGAPLKNLCDSFEPLRKLGDLPYIQPVIRVEPEGKAVKPQDVVFTIAAKAGPIRVTPDADGEIRFPFSDALCAENPDIESNQPPGSLGISITIDPKMPPVQRIDYRQLDTLRQQWDTAVSRQGFFYRMLAPSPKGFEVQFDPRSKATAEVGLPQGARQLAANAQGILVIPFDRSWAAANPTIAFSELPKRIGLSGKDR